MLERKSELQAIDERLRAAARGHGTMTAIVGPAGIGKSSLLAAAGGSGAARGFELLRARGGELERDFGFGIVRQLIEPALAARSESERAALLAGHAARARPLVDAGGEPTEFGDAHAVLHGLYWLFANLAGRSPCLLIVDDLHWSDAASLRFLAYLQRRADSLAVAILVGTRPAVEAAQPELLERVISAPGVERVSPAPLSEPAVASLLDGAFEISDPDVARAVHGATGGNPYLCRLAGEDLAHREQATVADLGPDPSAELVARHVGPLPAASEALARAVAVLGSEVPLPRAAALAGLDEGAAVRAADALAARGVFAPGPLLEFTHPLVRTVLREQIPVAERGSLHARAARLLRAEAAPDEAVAVQLLAAPPAADPEVVEALRAAARAARAKGDPASAATHLRRALSEPPPAAARADVELELGEAELGAGEAQRAAEHLERAKVEPGSGRGLRRARVLALAWISIGAYERAVDVLREAIEATPSDTDLALQLEGELYQCAMMLPETYARLGARFADREGTLAGDTPGERSLLTALATEACLRTQGAESVRELALRAFDRGLLDDRAPYSIVWTNGAFPLVFAEGFEPAERIVVQALERAARDADPPSFVRARVVAALLRARQGAMPEAEADARRAVEMTREGRMRIGMLATEPLVAALLARGAVAEADEALATLGPQSATRATFLGSWTLLARARVRLAQRRLDDAIADLRALQERESGWHPWNPAMFPYRSELALALRLGGELDEARSLAEQELALAERWGAPATLAAALRTLGLLADGADGIELLERSVERAAGSGARLEHARSLCELGAARRRAGERKLAREPLLEAMELAHRCGAGVLAERAREELVATGARPRRAVRSGVDALTPSELRVARMAASGMTNREIAQELFVTVRTVQVHLTGSYRKLEISSREELAAALEPDADAAA